MYRAIFWVLFSSNLFGSSVIAEDMTREQYVVKNGAACILDGKKWAQVSLPSGASVLIVKWKTGYFAIDVLEWWEHFQDLSNDGTLTHHTYPDLLTADLFCREEQKKIWASDDETQVCTNAATKWLTWTEHWSNIPEISDSTLAEYREKIRSEAEKCVRDFFEKWPEEPLFLDSKY